jgi:hypothetical protein
MGELQEIDREQMTPTEQLAARVLLGRRANWNPDVAIRYLPIVDLIRERGLEHQITDVGCGPEGIAPYLRLPITGVDTDLKPPVHPLMTPVNASVLETGFPDASRPCVISVDMLEHVPPDVRQAAVDELVRVAGRLLVIAVPTGPVAEAHDRAVADKYRAVRGVEYRYLREHLENGLPTEEDLRRYMANALERHGRTAQVSLRPNADLRLRRFIVDRWIHRRLPDKALWVVLTWASRLCARAHGGDPYRQIVVVDLTDASG